MNTPTQFDWLAAIYVAPSEYSVLSDDEADDEFYDEDKREFEPREPLIDPQTGFEE